MDMREFTFLYDCLRYSLLPLEKVLFWRCNNPILIGYFVESIKAIIFTNKCVK